MGVGYVQEMQSAGCGACLKHFACYNEEAHAWTIMSSYNRINGFHAMANEYLQTEVLKKCWSFNGMVMSDWGAVHETARVVAAGNDLEMPGPGHLSPV